MKSRIAELGRKGFTLIEVLVTLILIALLAAAVFPVMTQQISSADPAKASNDLSSIRSGVEMFNLNVRGTYPGDLEDLVTKITTTDVQTDQSSTFGTANVARWKGPYIDASIADAGTITTGFGGVIQDDLKRYDVTANKPEGATGFVTTNDHFVAVQITGLTSSDFEKMNDLIDGEAETDGATGSQALGKLRYNDAITASTFVTYYLAAPIAK